jgi:hypothetical protein
MSVNRPSANGLLGLVFWIVVAVALCWLFGAIVGGGSTLTLLVSTVVSAGLIIRYAISGQHRKDGVYRKFLMVCYFTIAALMFSLALILSYFGATQFQDSERKFFWYIEIPLLSALALGGIFVALGIYLFLKSPRLSRKQ